MSDTFLRIISVNESFVPDSIKIERTKESLIEIYEKSQMEIILNESIEFVDSGENFERIFCPLCGTEITIEDWQKAMDDAYKKNFTQLLFKSMCCKKDISLNNLNYKESGGFARFIISISNPLNIVSDSHIKRLEIILETRLKIILARI